MTAAHRSSVRFFQIFRISGFKPLVRQTNLWPKIPAALLCLASAAVADVSDNFIYLDNGPDVTITGYAAGAPPNVTVPATITISQDPLVVKTVARIGTSAFEGRFELTSVTIPSGVTGIDTRAFYNCSGITTVTMQSGLSSIGYRAFYNCKQMTMVTIPSGVTTIEADAFAGCDDLETVVIPSSVTVIGSGCFANCFSLANISLPPDILRVETSLFYGCSTLPSVTIPSKVNFVGARVFELCSKLTSISVAAGNLGFSSLDGVLFDYSGALLIAFPAGLGGGYSIPAGVTSIGSRAFYSCDRLVGVTFPSGVTTIGKDVFAGSDSLLYANFTGTAPTTVGTGVFSSVAAGFAVHYLDSSTGFGSPWKGYAAVNMGENNTSSTAWLLSKGLPANTDIQSDSNGDGVKLLMARALNLDPHRNLSGEMPRPVIAGNQMSLSYYAAAADITYAVESSTDLLNWSSAGVTYSGPATQRTATVSVSSPGRYMRLGVGN